MNRNTLKIMVCAMILVGVLAGIVEAANAFPNICIAAEDANTLLHIEPIGTWEVYEVTLNTTNSYSHPYLDVKLSATFSGPNETEITSDGFWDGGGNWKIRMAPTEAGTWNYTTHSTDSQLNGQAGSFKVVEAGKKGFIKINPDYPHTFMYDDGTPFFWLGDTVWGWFSSNYVPFNGTFQNWVDTRKSQGFTVLQGTLYTLGNSIFYSVPDETINTGFFQELDKRVQYATDQDMYILIQIDWSECWRAGMSGERYDRYAAYVVSRYSAYNVIWSVMGEYEEIWDDEAIRNAGQNIQSVNPYQHPVTTHTADRTTDSFGADAWIDFHGQQRKAISILDFNSLIISDRSYNKPVVNFEQCYETQTGYGCTNDKEYRQAGWAILTGGGFFTYGHIKTLAAEEPPDWSFLYSQGAAEMGYITTFWSEIEWWKMTPDNSFVTSGTAYCLAYPGYEYIAYLPSGGSVTIDLSATIGTFDTEWYDPKSGTYYDERTVTGGANVAFMPPFSGDAVLHIVSTVFDTGGGTYPSISGTHTGTIKPTDDIAVQKMYTCPCPGTGGHAEYVRIWNASGTIADGNWPGYEGDWHVIAFDNSFILKANETYNYTIRTGSYPQIIHAHTANVAGGTITCEEFVDVNGKSHNDGIPAIKLYSTEVARVSSNTTIDMGYVQAVSWGAIEPPATALYNSYNSVVKGLFKTFKSIKGIYSRLFYASYQN